MGATSPLLRLGASIHGLFINLTKEITMRSMHRYRVMAAITVALALSFAGVESASLEPSAAAAETLMAEFARTAPFEYSPGDYQSQGKEN